MLSPRRLKLPTVALPNDQQILKPGAEPAILRRHAEPGLPRFGCRAGLVTGMAGMAGRARMKTCTVAALMLALITVPAHAQARRPKGDEKKTEQKKPEVDEKAYKAALERIPEPKEKYDPWGIARPAEPAKKPK
jgi:hypothetical protein